MILISNFKLYRWLIGGTWYKFQLNGELPNCYGLFWTQTYDNTKYVDLIKTENYDKRTK